MKKGLIRLASIFFLLLFSLLLFSCNNDSENNKSSTTETIKPKLMFSETTIELTVGEEYILNPIQEGNITSITYSVENQSIISCSNQGVITAVKAGTSKLYVVANGDQSTKVTLTITVKANNTGIDVGDVEENRLIYNQLISKVNSFSQKIDNSNYLTFTIKADVDGNTSSQTIKAINNPIYIETKTDADTYPMIIQEEDGKIFQYTFINSNSLERRYLESKEEFMKDNDYEIDTQSFLSFTFDPNNGNAKMVGNSYVFTVLYKDALDENSKEIIESLYNLLGIPVTNLYNSIVVITYSINDKSISFSLNLEIVLQSFKYKSRMIMTYDISIDEFTKIDLSDPKYRLSKPTCFEEVRETTDITKPYVLESYAKDYLKVTLEEGQYYISDEENNASNLIIDIYDLDLNKIPSTFNISSIYVPLFNTTFVIPETKEYYIKLDNNISRDRTISFNKLDYDTYVDIRNPKVLTNNNSGTIEGLWDFEYYEYNASEKTILKITNTGENIVSVICTIYGDEYQNYNIHVNNHIYVKVDKGINKFYINSNTTSSITYSLNVEVIENNNGTETNYNNMDVITTEYSDKLYMAGYGINDKYLKLIVDKKGMFYFDYECIELGMSLQFAVTNKNGEGVLSVGYNKYHLDIGEYIVRITNNNHVFGIGKVKYRYLDTSDKSIEVNLSKQDLANINNNDFTNLKNQKVLTSQIIKYYFTLSEDSTVLYDERYMYIYDSNDNLLSLTPPYYTNQNYGLIELKAGRYYFTTPSMYGESDITLKIAIVEQDRDTKQDFTNMTKLQLGQTINVSKNWLYDKEYFQLDIKEKGRYYLSGGRFYIFDEDFNQIETENEGNLKKFNCEIGTYYVMYIYDNNKTSSSIYFNKSN